MWKAATIVVATAVTGFAAALPAVAQTASTVPSPPQSSSERVRDNPSSQYVLVKTVVGQSIGVVDARALPVEPELQVQPDPYARYIVVDRVLAVIKRSGVGKLGFVGNEQYARVF